MHQNIQPKHYCLDCSDLQHDGDDEDDVDGDDDDYGYGEADVAHDFGDGT